MPLPAVLIATPVHPALPEGLRSKGYSVLMRETISPGGALLEAAQCAGIITANRLAIDAPLLAAGAGLQWVGRLGSGLEIIDVAAAAARGIRVFSSPEGNCNAVAEHALGMLLSLTKKIGLSHRQVMSGQWLREENRGTELEGKTIGIIGYGHTGQAFARKLLGLDVQVLAYDRKGAVAAVYPHVTVAASLDEMYAQADVVSFHVPLAADTRHYFNAAFLRSMQRPFYLINTSRGAVVDLAALMAGLQKGAIRGACLDVLEGEPLSAMNAPERALAAALAVMPQVIITPHIGGYSTEALYKMSAILLGKIPAAILS